jgi:hypothetical protein
VDIPASPPKLRLILFTIHWHLFAPALLLLWFPADRLLSSSVRLRSLETFTTLERSPERLPWWCVPALWMDPIRAFGGMLLLMQAFALDVSGAEWALLPKAGYSIVNAVLAVAVLIQMFTRRREEVMLAPLGFVGGLVAALVPWPVALIAFPMAIATVFAFRQLHAFFAIGFVMVGLLGFLFKAEVAWLATALGLLALPLGAMLVTGFTLELPTRGPTKLAEGS